MWRTDRTHPGAPDEGRGPPHPDPRFSILETPPRHAFEGMQPARGSACTAGRGSDCTEIRTITQLGAIPATIWTAYSNSTGIRARATSTDPGTRLLSTACEPPRVPTQRRMLRARLRRARRKPGIDRPETHRSRRIHANIPTGLAFWHCMMQICAWGGICNATRTHNHTRIPARQWVGEDRPASFDARGGTGTAIPGVHHGHRKKGPLRLARDFAESADSRAMNKK